MKSHQILAKTEQSSVPALASKLQNSTASAAPDRQDAMKCENGVCSILWKPSRQARAS